MQETMQEHKRDAGFTLIELLIAIVVVGILTAVAIVGIGSLVNSGEGAACNASRDAAQAAGAVYYANNAGTPPPSLAAMVGDELTLTGNVTVGPVGSATENVMNRGTDWSITYTPATQTFTACP